MLDLAFVQAQFLCPLVAQECIVYIERLLVNDKNDACTHAANSQHKWFNHKARTKALASSMPVHHRYNQTYTYFAIAFSLMRLPYPWHGSTAHHAVCHGYEGRFFKTT